MKKVFIGVIILSMVGMVVWRFSKESRREAASQDLLLRSSEAKTYSQNITILGDEWLGYMVFRSRAFQDSLAAADIGVTFKVEHNFQKRFEDLRAGKADLVLATADSYLVNGESAQYPGVICAVIDESYGGDALIAAAGISSIDELNSKKVKGAYVGYSPSEFLLKSQVAHFQLDELAPRLSSYREDSAEAAYNKLAQGQVDFAVLWEPYASRALKKVSGSTKLIDTSQAQDLIVDVAIASRKLAADNPALLKQVLSAYFTALSELQGDPERLLRQATIDSGEKKADAQQMLSGIRFVNYRNNKSEWLDPSGNFRLKRALSSITDILLDVGDLKAPLSNPDAIIHSKSLLGISSTLSKSSQGSASSSLGHFFKELSAEEWLALSKDATGTLMNRPISFSAGSSEIDQETKEELLKASDKLQHYPYHRLMIQAHVSPGGGEEIEQQLSAERAGYIRDYLLANTDLKPARIHAAGRGAADALPRKDGESSRAWKRRCRRASILIGAE